MKIEQLEQLARDLIGDGKTPNIFFVTFSANVILITTDKFIAYEVWKKLPKSIESSLEDRRHGCICTTEPLEDDTRRLTTIDDFHNFRLD